MLLLTWSSPVSVVLVTRLLCSRVGEPWDECWCYEPVEVVCLVIRCFWYVCVIVWLNRETALFLSLMRGSG